MLKMSAAGINSSSQTFTPNHW